MTFSVQQLLTEADISFTDNQHRLIQQYMDLIQQWNPYVSLVSIPDLERLYECHVVDALSLAPFVHKAPGAPHLLDIGSGADESACYCWCQFCNGVTGGADECFIGGG